MNKRLSVSTESGVELVLHDMTPEQEIEMYQDWLVNPSCWVTSCGKLLRMEMVDVA